MVRGPEPGCTASRGWIVQGAELGTGVEGKVKPGRGVNGHTPPSFIPPAGPTYFQPTPSSLP